MPRIAAAVTVVIVMGACIGFNTVRYPAVWEMVAGAHQPPGPSQPVPDSQSPAFSETAPSADPGESAPFLSESPDTSLASAGVDPIPFPNMPGSARNEWEDDWSDEKSSSSEEMASATSDSDEPSSSYGRDDPYDDSEDDEEYAYESYQSYGDSDDSDDSYGYDSYGGESSQSGYDYDDEPEPQPLAASPSMKYGSGSSDSYTSYGAGSRDSRAGAVRRPLVPVESAARDRYNETPAGEDRSAALDHRVERLPSLNVTGDAPYRARNSVDGEEPLPIYPSTHEL